MNLATLTSIHTVISLGAILAGFVVVFGMMRRQASPFWIAAFLGSALATSVTGFFFPFDHFLPSHWVGVVSLIVLGLAVLGHYVFGQSAFWKSIYLMGSIIGLYLLVFVLIVQAFLKVPALHALAPTQSEPAFAVAQIGALIFFLILSIAAARASRPRPATT